MSTKIQITTEGNEDNGDRTCTEGGSILPRARSLGGGRRPRGFQLSACSSIRSASSSFPLFSSVPVRFFRCVVGLAAVLFAASASASPHSPDTDWFCDAGWGVFVHYLWDVQNVGGRENTQGKPPTTWDALVREFDTEKFAEQVQETGAPYVFFTPMQRTRYLIAPNATYDRLTGYKPGEARSTRDLVADLYRSLDKRGIKLMLYWTGDGPREDAQAARGMGGWNGQVSDQYVRNWAAVAAEYSRRYGDKVKSWWVDGCYAHIGYNEARWRVLSQGVKAGNPHAIIALNNPAMAYANSSTDCDDFTTGEVNAFTDIPEAVRLSEIEVEPVECRPNLLRDPGFEEMDSESLPAGWRWDRRNTDAACMADRAHAHRGRQSLLITNGTAFGPHVYGMLWLAQPVRLSAGKPYTMSAWVSSDAPGILSLIGGSDWQFRAQASRTDGQWRRIWKTFTPGTNDTDFTLRISTESPTPGVWIDDLKLEEGTAPTADPLEESDKVFLEAEQPQTLIQGDGPFNVAFTLSNARAVAGGLSARLGTHEPVRQTVSFASGVWRVLVKGESAAAGDAPCALTLRLEEANQESATAGASLRFFSAANALQRLGALKAELPALKADLQMVKLRGQDPSYPAVTATVLENFIGYAEEDARRGEVRRSLEQVGDLEQMAARLGSELKEALAGRRQFPAVPRWTGDHRPVIRSSSFVAPVRLPGGVPQERPVFFTGYGHFGQVVSDMEKWPDYGVNIIQIELGPSRVFPTEGRTDEAPVRELSQVLDRAQKSGVAVCLLISPHYMPGWALEKWPQLQVRREGFLQYCLHAPEGRELLRRFVHAALAPIKGHPALHSICLSNEPVNQEEPCEPARQQWRTWLERRHGSIAALSSLCGSNFAAFAEVPLPNPFGPRPAPALWMDYIRFNQEAFADWHRMLADAVHEVAPGLPVHAKAMTWTLINDGDVKYGVDATLFARFSDLNGNDSVNFFDFGDEEFAQGWQLNAMGHDLQRSVLDAPVFNTENHLIEDRDTRYVPAAHIRAALWQAAVHGQSATAIWVWERTFDPKSDFAGSIMHRPACAEAVGIVNYDLNRAALEVTALQQAPAQALVLQSVTASVWDGGDYGDCFQKLYTALSFTGLKLGFVTERQSETGSVPQAPVVFVPGVVHLSGAALEGLRQFKGRVVLVGGNDVLARDEYGRQRRPELGTVDRLAFRHGSTSSRQLREQILARLPAWDLRPTLELREAGQRATWGVEWRSAEIAQGTVVNLCNYRKEPTTAVLMRDGRPVAAQDVLTGQPVEGPLTLAPLEVQLLRLR